MVARPAFTWLEPPTDRGAITVDALVGTSQGAYVDTVWAWARAVWDAWAPHHGTVRAWIGPSLD